MFSKLRYIVGSFFVLSLIGCAATNTALTKHNLTVETKMSDSIFLDPVEDNQKTIYVDVKNTSDYSNFNLKSDLTNDLNSKGYKVVTSMNSAHYIIQANIRQIGKTKPEDARSTMKAGYGGAISGGIIGITAGAMTGDAKTAAAGGLIGGTAGFLANSLIKDVAYTVITDVQISERAKKGELVKQEQKANLQQGSNTTIKQSSNTTSDWYRYRTRVVSIADQMNLSFEKAQPTLEKSQASSLAGMF